MDIAHQNPLELHSLSQVERFEQISKAITQLEVVRMSMSSDPWFAESGYDTHPINRKLEMEARLAHQYTDGTEVVIRSKDHEQALPYVTVGQRYGSKLVIPSIDTFVDDLYEGQEYTPQELLDGTGKSFDHRTFLYTALANSAHKFVLKRIATNRRLSKLL